MALIDLTRSDAKIDAIAASLDDLPEAQRLDQLFSLTAQDQARLYEKAADAPPLDLDFFVPSDIADELPVIHYGKNSQPAFRNFEKRWARPNDRPGELWGYNETRVRPLIGPGYFVARRTDDDGSDPRGAVVVDYFQVPPADASIADWPPVRPNSKGLQKFVYNKTRDYMRRVSGFCSIGVAYRLESRVMGYFVLCRERL